MVELTVALKVFGPVLFVLGIGLFTAISVVRKKQNKNEDEIGNIRIGGDNSGNITTTVSVNQLEKIPKCFDGLGIFASICSIIGCGLTIWGYFFR